MSYLELFVDGVKETIKKYILIPKKKETDQNMKNSYL